MDRPGGLREGPFLRNRSSLDRPAILTLLSSSVEDGRFKVDGRVIRFLTPLSFGRGGTQGLDETLFRESVELVGITSTGISTRDWQEKGISSEKPQPADRGPATVGIRPGSRRVNRRFEKHVVGHRLRSVSNGILDGAMKSLDGSGLYADNRRCGQQGERQLVGVGRAATAAGFGLKWMFPRMPQWGAQHPVGFFIDCRQEVTRDPGDPAMDSVR